MPDRSQRILDAQADAFARLLATSTDIDATFRQAASLADGLFPHQVEGVAFLLGRRRAILADDMGLGKTRQAIVALRHTAPDGPYLVICPASVKRNWEREISACTTDAVHLVEGTTAQAIPGGARWVVVNYDILSKHIDRLSAVGWSGLVFDEAHYLKNHTSTRSRLARRLAERALATAPREPAVYLLTGTPLTNRPRDLFVLLQLVNHALGRSFLSFAKRYCAATHHEYGWKTDGASNLEELTVQLHGIMLRRRKDDVLSLPPKLRTWLPTSVPPGTASLETREAVKLLLTNGGHGGLATDVGRRADANHRGRVHLLALLTKARERLAAAKAATTRDFVAGAVDQGEKVIVFSCFEAPLNELAASFGDQAVAVTGKTPSATRQHLVDRFQRDEDVRVFLANIVAGGIGLTLTAATQVVFNDLDWVPANHWQAEDRAYRLGQTKTVNVTYMVAAETIDDFVQAVLEAKAGLVRSVIEGEALGGELGGGVLEELERALAALSPALADGSPTQIDQDTIGDLLQEATARWRASRSPQEDGARASMPPEHLAYLRKAIETLAGVLAGPKALRFRVSSSSQPDASHEISVDGADVTCTCPGFEYRGQCRHAREVKNAIASGRAVPTGYVAF